MISTIIGWETHEKWVSFLLQALTREVPPGYASITINQLLRADSELFLLMSKEITSVKPDASGRMQVDEAMNRLKTDARVTMFVLPLPRSASSVSAPSQVDPPPPPPSKRTRTRSPPRKKGLMAPVKKDNLLEELKGAKFLTAFDGRRLCWSHNCDGCSLDTDGKSPHAPFAGKRAMVPGIAGTTRPIRTKERAKGSRPEEPRSDSPTAANVARRLSHQIRRPRSFAIQMFRPQK